MEERRKPSPAMSPPRYASASSNEPAIDVNTRPATGRVAPRERDSRSNTRGPSCFFIVTRSAFSRSSAVATTYSRRSGSLGPRSSGRKSTRRKAGRFLAPHHNRLLPAREKRGRRERPRSRAMVPTTGEFIGLLLLVELKNHTDTEPDHPRSQDVTDLVRVRPILPEMARKDGGEIEHVEDINHSTQNAPFRDRTSYRCVGPRARDCRSAPLVP